MKSPAPEGAPRIDVSCEELEALLEKARAALGETGYQKLQAAIRTLGYVTELLQNQEATLASLRRLLCHSSTEKTSKVLEQAGIKAPPKNSPPPNAPGPPKPGHGRNGAQAYGGARRIKIAHASLQPGNRCPECQKGKVYEQKDPALRIRVVGQAPIAATVYELERLRCNLCGEIFEAAAPASVGEKKYDETAAAMIALLKYGSGVPFYRLEGLEASLGIPLPASTQWEIVEEIAAPIRPAFDELLRQAAQGEVFYNDDTSMKILALARASPSRPEGKEESSSAHERTGLFTTGIVSTTRQGQRIVMFFTGRKHAGENLARVLVERAKGLAPPIQMCDALSRNLPGKLKTLLANCLAHGRRQFVDVADLFPEECRHVLEALAVVYHNDAIAGERNLSPEERLLFHQAQSGRHVKDIVNDSYVVEHFDEVARSRILENPEVIKGIEAHMRRQFAGYGDSVAGLKPPSGGDKHEPGRVNDADMSDL